MLPVLTPSAPTPFYLPCLANQNPQLSWKPSTPRTQPSPSSTLLSHPEPQHPQKMRLAPPLSPLRFLIHSFLQADISELVSHHPQILVSYSFANTSHPQTLLSSRNPILLHVSIFSISSPPYDPKLPSHSPIIASPTFPLHVCHRRHLPKLLSSCHTLTAPKAPKQLQLSNHPPLCLTTSHPTSATNPFAPKLLSLANLP